MRTFLFSISMMSFLLISCKDDKAVDIANSAATDPFGDITFLGSGFYTTNYNTSMKGGPQVFLYKLTGDGKVIENKFNLYMNGQGYLAITNDSTNLYLQSRDFNSVIKCSPVGEVYYNNWFVRTPQWQGCGIGYDAAVDSLCVLVRDLNNLNYYELLFIDKNNTSNWHVKSTATIAGLNRTTGAYAIEVKGNELCILGQDTTNTDILIKTSIFLDTLDYTVLNTDSTTGFCFKGNDLFFSFLSRNIEQRNP